MTIAADPPVFITTAIPYVNAKPHLGFALELILGDALARFYRQRGRDVRFQTGSDENSLKNVHAALRAGIPTTELVERNAAAFAALAGPLNLNVDDFVRTSSQPRHRHGVAKLWQACVARGDVYKKAYGGHYCVGCEQFYSPTELVDGRCVEHGAVQWVQEENHFFRLSRYNDRLLKLIESGKLEIVPEGYRNEVLAFVRSGLQDFSISRSSERARGWGISVPGDKDHVVYVWFDALGNYITALDYADEGELLGRYWGHASQRIHVLGKGVTRFHAVYWPAVLLSAGLAVPSTIVVHGYLTVDGAKISKSVGNTVDPVAVAEAHGSDALRYLLCRYVRQGRDADFSYARLQTVHDGDLADQLGNLLSRTTSMIQRYAHGRIPESRGHDPHERELVACASALPTLVEAAVQRYRLDEALDAIWDVLEASNRYIVAVAPWRLAKAVALDPERTTLREQLDRSLYVLAEVLRLVAVLAWPVIPVAARRILRDLGAHEDVVLTARTLEWGQLVAGTQVRKGPALFPKVALGSAGSACS